MVCLDCVCKFLVHRVMGGDQGEGPRGGTKGRDLGTIYGTKGRDPPGVLCTRWPTHRMDEGEEVPRKQRGGAALRESL